jgi:hypothetical protein
MVRGAAIGKPRRGVAALTGDRNSGKGEEYRAAYRLAKDLCRGKNTEHQSIFHLGTGLAICVSGDDFVVVHAAFSVDERLNNDRVVTICNPSGRLK